MDDALAVTRRVVWCAMTTVDAAGRPRNRVVHPVWEEVDGALRGWVTTRRSPVKAAHLATNPNVGCAYVGSDHDVAYLDCTARWATAVERRHAWDVCRSLEAPAGFDPASIWPDGPESPGAEVLRLEPYRAQVGLAADLATGAAPRLWP
jgi:general stress protein 26